MPEFSKEEIVDYYDVCEKNYRRWWDLDKSLAMHAGYWDKSTKTLRDALVKENEILADHIKITSSDKVLDAGCGYGGSSLYLSEKRHCDVTGITLCQKQVDTATREAVKRKLSSPPKFLVMDYTKTNFSDNTFDVVWAIESVCHAKDKKDFIQEAMRILKPGGRLVVTDGFLARNSYTPQEKKLLGKAVNGWAVETMESIPNFERFLHESGFKEVQKKDITANVTKSSRRLFLISFPAILYSKLGEFFGWSTKIQTQDFKSYHYQYWAVRKKLCNYIIFSAVK
jgi:tocopherol O-methyltransferase